MPLPNASQMKDTSGQAKAEYVKKLHEKVKAQIEKKLEGYAKHANKGRKKVVFKPGDWVWVHFRKERFPSQRKSKLMPRGDGPFQVLAKINDNAYKIDLPGEYGVSATFNVSDLSLFDVGDEGFDLRANASEEGGNDEDIDVEEAQDQAQVVTLEPLQDLGGPMTRARAKKAKEALNHMINSLLEAQQQQSPEDTRVKIICLICHMEEHGEESPTVQLKE